MKSLKNSLKGVFAVTIASAVAVFDSPRRHLQERIAYMVPVTNKNMFFVLKCWLV